MHIIELDDGSCESIKKQIGKLFCREDTCVISHLPKDIYTNYVCCIDEPRQVSFIRSYWMIDGYFTILFEKIANVLIKLNYFFRLDIKMDEYFIYNPTPEYIVEVLKAKIQEVQEICFAISTYGEDKEKWLGIVLINDAYGSIVFSSIDNALSELVEKLVVAEGLFIY